jgi:hypothetical protein
MTPAETKLKLAKGVNTFVLETDVPAQHPGNGDLRKLSFSISDYGLTEIGR